jgi:hypothetical protein
MRRFRATVIRSAEAASRGGIPLRPCSLVGSSGSETRRPLHRRAHPGGLEASPHRAVGVASPPACPARASSQRTCAVLAPLIAAVVWRRWDCCGCRAAAWSGWGSIGRIAVVAPGAAAGSSMTPRCGMHTAAAERAWIRGSWAWCRPATASGSARRTTARRADLRGTAGRTGPVPRGGDQSWRAVPSRPSSSIWSTLRVWVGSSSPATRPNRTGLGPPAPRTRCPRPRPAGTLPSS